MNALKQTLDLLSFPTQALQELLAAQKKLSANPSFSAFMDQALADYRSFGTLDYEGCANKAKELSGGDVSAQTGVLLFFLLLCPAAKEHYQKEGLSDALFRDSFYDLTLKAVECKKVDGVWGTSTAWFGRFFDRTRFRLGRLEFEDCKLHTDYREFKEGDPAINIHIPEDGALDHGDCLCSYRLAADFFPKCAKNGITPFVCSSWLLAQELRSILSGNSNILRFAADFEILSVRTEKGFPDGWRVFADKWKEPPERLPRNTSLQRGYADYLLTHDCTTVPFGAFRFDGRTGCVI